MLLWARAHCFLSEVIWTFVSISGRDFDVFKMGDNTDKFSSKSNISELHLKYMLQIMETCIREVAIDGIQRNEPILRFRNPEHLRGILSFRTEEIPCPWDKMEEIIKEIIAFSAKTDHPRYFYQFSAGLDTFGLLGSWLTDLLNVNAFTYECSPVFTLMEKYVVKQVVTLFGYPENAEAIFCPGGSLGNGFAMNLARQHKFPSVKMNGMTNEKELIVFVSEDAHYSVYKMAALLGIGIRNVVAVKTDLQGRMDVSDLKQVVEEYCTKNTCIPFAVIATAGTTVLGAFDPLDEIADICQTYDLWLHVDAAWGGSVILSKKYKHCLNGIKKSNSFIWNPSKTLAIPQQCSLLFIRFSQILREGHSFPAPYLFRDKFYDSEYDLGDVYMQCGRKPDVLKLWLMWKAKGQAGLEHHVNTLLDTAEYLTSQIRELSDFRLVCEPSFINVCFWYVPCGTEKNNFAEIRDTIDEIAPNVAERLLRTGTIMISTQHLRQLPNFFRFVCSSSSVTRSDCDYLLSQIQTTAETYLRTKNII